MSAFKNWATSFILAAIPSHIAWVISVECKHVMDKHMSTANISSVLHQECG